MNAPPREAIRHLNEAAFACPEEAALVNALRGNGRLLIPLVAGTRGGNCRTHCLQPSSSQ